MVLTLELDDLVPPGKGPGQAEGVHHHLRTRVLIDHLLRRRDHLGEPAGERPQFRRRRGEVGAPLQLFRHCPVHRRGAVAQEHGAEAQDVVDVLVAVHVVEFGALPAGHGDGVVPVAGDVEGTAYPVHQVRKGGLVEPAGALGVVFLHGAPPARGLPAPVIGFCPEYTPWPGGGATGAEKISLPGFSPLSPLFFAQGSQFYPKKSFPFGHFPLLQ